MCNYLIVGTGISLPVEDALGEEQVINRALNLLPDFSDLKLYKQNGSGKYQQVADFLRQKVHRRQHRISRVIRTEQRPVLSEVYF